MTLYEAFIDELNKLGAGIKRTFPPRGQTQTVRPLTLKPGSSPGGYFKTKPQRPGWMTPRAGTTKEFSGLKKAPVSGLTGAFA